MCIFGPHNPFQFGLVLKSLSWNTDLSHGRVTYATAPARASLWLCFDARVGCQSSGFVPRPVGFDNSDFGCLHLATKSDFGEFSSTCRPFSLQSARRSFPERLMTCSWPAVWFQSLNFCNPDTLLGLITSSIWTAIATRHSMSLKTFPNFYCSLVQWEPVGPGIQPS